MKKLLILIGLILLFLIIIYICYANMNLILTAKDPLQDEDFEIASLKLNLPIFKVFEILGQPNNSVTKNKVVLYYFSDVIVKSYKFGDEFGEKVIGIIALNDRVKTLRGVGIGDKEEKVVLHYGTTEKYNNVLSYQKDYQDHARGIYFLIEKGRIKKIEVYIAAD